MKAGPFDRSFGRRSEGVDLSSENSFYDTFSFSYGHLVYSGIAVAVAALALPTLLRHYLRHSTPDGYIPTITNFVGNVFSYATIPFSLLCTPIGLGVCAVGGVAALYFMYKD